MSRGGHGCWSVSLRFRISRFPGGHLETDRYHTSALQVHENECKHVVFHGISSRVLVTPGLCTLGEQFRLERTATYVARMRMNAVVARVSSGIPRKLSSFPKTPTTKDGEKDDILPLQSLPWPSVGLFLGDSC